MPQIHDRDEPCKLCSADAWSGVMMPNVCEYSASSLSCGAGICIVTLMLGVSDFISVLIIDEKY